MNLTEMIQREAMDLTRTDIVEWVQERYENCLRIAAEKPDSEKGGWLADAVYYCAIIGQIGVTE